MKFRKLLTLIPALLAAALLLLAGCAEEPHTSTETDDAFRITDYAVTMSVDASREIKTVEKISVQFARRRHGIIRDFDLTGGVRYEDISALRNGQEILLGATNDDSALLSLALGDEDGPYLDTGTVYVYEISYRMIVPDAGKNYLPLDVLGYDWLTAVDRFTAEVHLPGDVQKTDVFSGRAGSEENSENAAVRIEGNTVFVEAEGLAAHRGITVDLLLQDGVLSGGFDFTYLWAGLCIAAIAVLFVLMKLLCRQPLLVRTVNFTAPQEMDPLKMGKLIDGTVDSEDLGSLVLWLAAKGCLTIDLTADKDDPILRKTGELPADAPGYCRRFFEGLFVLGNEVTVSSLKYSFSSTAETVKKTAGELIPPLYRGKGTAAIVLLGIFAVLLTGGFVWLYSLLKVGPFYQVIAPLVLAAVSYIVAAAVSVRATMRSMRTTRVKTMFTRLMGLIAGLVCALFSTLFYGAAVTRPIVAILIFAAAIAGMGGGYLLIRTEEYTKLLGQILGFREFLLYTEKDRIAAMLEEDPALFFNVLPYAQVLGVTDAWAKKFEDLTVTPPGYLTYDATDIVLTSLFWNMTFRSMTASMSRTFVARPTNSGGGFHGGGFGGGFGGGGFGGGGGRSF